MCGIVGYVGYRDAFPLTTEALTRHATSGGLGSEWTIGTAALMPCIRIVIAEDDPGFREWLYEQFRFVPDFEVVGAVCNGREAIASVAQLDPDILILDLDLPGINGLEVLQVVRWFSPNTKVIIRSSHAEESTILEALQLGAMGYIVNENGIDLQKAIRAVRGGEIWARRRVLARLLDHLVGLASPASQITEASHSPYTLGDAE